MAVTWRYVDSPEDVEILRVLRNAGREWFGDSKEISSDEQTAWWAANKGSLRCLLVGVPPVGYGMIRWRDGRSWVSLAVDPVVRGQGWGQRIYQLLADLARIEDTQIFAAIRIDNVASLTAARRAGYRLATGVDPPGIPVDQMKNWTVLCYP